MDEAERCHRLAILDNGRLVADGTPAALTAGLQGRTLGVRTGEPRRAQALLHGLPGVLGIAQIGNELRVLAGAAPSAGEGLGSRLLDALQAQGLDAEVVAIAPNLEDVFVAATHARGRGAGA